MNHHADELARRMAADDLEVDAAASRAVAALQAWRSFPGFIRRGYPKEAHRLARRAAVAVLELVATAAAATPEAADE